LTSFFPRKVSINENSSLYKSIVKMPLEVVFFTFYPKKWLLPNDIKNVNNTYNKEVILNKNGEQFNIIEYALIIVFIICGATFLISTADLVSIFLSIELQSYGLYILCTLYRDSELSTGSGLTYFLLGGLSSCFILLGSALLYVNSGTTNIDNIYIITRISESSFFNKDLHQILY
jgi:hypothetical protein